MNELETILYGYVLEHNYFGVSKPTAPNFNEVWNYGDCALLNPYTNKQIWKAALKLEKKGLISLDYYFSANVADCHKLTPHEIAKKKCKK